MIGSALVDFAARCVKFHWASLPVPETHGKRCDRGNPAHLPVRAERPAAADSVVTMIASSQLFYLFFVLNSPRVAANV